MQSEFFCLCPGNNLLQHHMSHNKSIQSQQLISPHAGNLLATPDGRLCYLDFGMMSYAAAKQRNGFLLAVVHIVNRDWSALVKVYQNLGFIPEGTDLKPIELALEEALPDVLNADISELNFKNVVGEFGYIIVVKREPLTYLHLICFCIFVSFHRRTW